MEEISDNEEFFSDASHDDDNTNNDINLSSVDHDDLISIIQTLVPDQPKLGELLGDQI